MSTTPPWLPAAAGISAAAAAVDCRRSPVHSLPNELLVAIFAHLDASSSLEPRFHDDPSTLMDDYLAARRRPWRGRGPFSSSSSSSSPPSSSAHPLRYSLKATSLVCHRWRDAVLPLLFRHVLWTFRRLEEPPPPPPLGVGPAADAAKCFDLLAFLRRNRLGHAVEGLTLHVPCPEHLIDDPTELVGRFGLVPNSTAAGHQFHAHGEGEEDAGEDAESVVLSETASLVLSEVNGHATWANTWFWDMLFGVVDPLRVTLLAAPVVLATMLSRKIFTRCQPLMMTRYHLLSVSRSARSSAVPPAPLSTSSIPASPDSDSDFDSDSDSEDLASDPVTTTTLSTEPSHRFSPPCDNLPCELFARTRLWTSLLANEGSSVSIYKTDAYGETPPSPLLSLLASRDRDTRRFFLRRSLRRLAYVAIVPMATHVQVVLTSPTLVPPRLQELFVQVMPRGVIAAAAPATEELGEEDEGGAWAEAWAGFRGFSGSFEGLEVADLIVERDAVYALLFGSIFVPGPRPEFEALRVFETGDADDNDPVAWMEAVEAVQASAVRWNVTAKGRLVRDVKREMARRRS
ncbi:F-box domain-containing protein [Cordyceps javanica]|uniref:F-box domain-containing protein n=1 Tax=Cordyceps javanica TaxID=43265 RepID=A0A545VVP1_9HYPO|nr:F-box domain-containing protein [Cordyceps javanica]TQW05788.1 F-box domain-containing protein [Cordyceps javanica]